MRVYLAGPMTGIPQFNFPAFDAAEADLLSRGHEVIPPADLHDEEVRPIAMASRSGAISDLPPHLTWGEFLSNDVKLIADAGIEAIVCLEGWERSRGARLEAFVGRLCGLMVLEYHPLCELAPVPTARLRVVLGGVA